MTLADTSSSVAARPVRTARAAKLVAGLILVLFVFTAIVMRRDNAGVKFVPTDQLGTVVIGLILAAAALLPTRPRLYADASGVRIRAFLGAERLIPWDVVVRVDFPKKLRFARLVLPGEETLALYAVQRWDHDESVAVMRRLRELFAQSRPTLQIPAALQIPATPQVPAAPQPPATSA